MRENRYELQSKHAGEGYLVKAVYAFTDKEAIELVAGAATRALEAGAVDLVLWRVEVGDEKEIKRYIGGGAKS